MEIKERRVIKQRRITDRRNRVDPDYKGQERRIMLDRRTQKGKRKSD